MPSRTDAISSLAALLQSSSASPVVSPSRLAPSAAYDIDYRMAVIALVFDAFAKPFGPDLRRIRSARLKLLQFLAVRPWLVPAVREWSQGTGQAAFAFAYSMRIRRGFLSDTAYEDVINFFAVTRVFSRQQNHVVTGDNVQFALHLAASVKDEDLFARERATIEKLKTIKITDAMLEGW